MAILPPLHTHSPPVWTHVPWLEPGHTHFEGSDGWREDEVGRKERKRGGREGRLRRRKGGGESTDLSEGEPGVRRSVSLHTRAGRERREKVTKVGSEKSD